MGSTSDQYDKHINLQLGWPTPSLFPSRALTEAAQKTLLNDEIAAQSLVYGPDPGHELVRKSTAEWLTRFYQPEAGKVCPSRLFVTPGASAGLSMLLARFTNPNITQYIWMIEPTYFLACPIFEEAGFHGRLRGIPEDSEGIDIEFLRAGLVNAERELQHDQAVAAGAFARCSKLYKHVIYIVPTFSNPSAMVMSMSRRKQLLQLAREFDALIVSDDVYDWLRWQHPDSPENTELPKTLPRLVDLDRSMPGGTAWGNAISNGSFSKIVAPGVRVGWIEGTPLIAEQLCKVGPVHSGGCQSHLSSMLIGSLLSSGKLEEHIRSTLIPVYQRRHRVMLKSIAAHLQPLGFRNICTTSPDGKNSQTAPLAGGFFLYLHLPLNSPAAEQVAKVALQEFNLRVSHGSMMYVAGDSGSVQRAKGSWGQGVRLCWAWHEEADIDEGIQRLAAAFRVAQSRYLAL